jgi:hypothetical protein
VLHPVFNPFVEVADASHNTGIFDLTRADNPLRDATMVDLPYCTGDVHLGNRDVTYTVADDSGGSREVRIHHGGSTNVRAGLEWAVRNVPRPQVVVVVGFSAGAIASPYYAGQLAARYPKARVVQLGDSGGGYRAAAIPGILDTWGATDRLREESGYRDLDPATTTFEDLYTHAARATPRVHFGQVNSAEDATQLQFLSLVGVQGVPLPVLLRRNLDEVRSEVSGLRTFTVPGETHVLLGRPEFYTLRVEGTLLRDWVAGYIEGRPVKDVGEDLLVGAPE